MTAGLRHHLIRILAISAAVLSLLVGGTVFFYEVRLHEQGMLSLAQDEALLFLRQMDAHLRTDWGDHSEVVNGLQELLAERAHRPGGHFVLGRVYSPSMDKRGEAGVGGHAVLPDAHHAELARLSERRAAFHEWRLLSDGMHIRFVVANTDAAGQVTGFFEGLYRLDTEALAPIIGEAAAAAGMAFAVVLLHTAFLYPLIVYLDRQLIRRSEALLEANLGILETLGSAVALRDSDTATHNYRVTIAAVRLAERIELDRDAMRKLIKGAFLHDIGKIAIPDAILLKPGRLTAAEFDTMKRHVDQGLEVVRHSVWLADAAEVVGGHHEKWDGAGYPAGRRGEAIPLIARLFAIADVFDALISRRPYKEPMPFGQALEQLEQGSGQHFDARLIEAFRRIGRSLYEELSTATEADLRKTLAQMTRRYFVG